MNKRTFPFFDSGLVLVSRACRGKKESSLGLLPLLTVLKFPFRVADPIGTENINALHAGDVGLRINPDPTYTIEEARQLVAATVAIFKAILRSR